jgi:hypothetical protein
MLRSIADQQKNPQNYSNAVLKKLDKKIKYLQEIKIIPVAR